MKCVCDHLLREETWISYDGLGLGLGCVRTVEVLTYGCARSGGPGRAGVHLVEVLSERVCVT